MSGVLAAKDKVQRYLSDFVGSVDLLPDGRLAFEYGSTRLFVRVDGRGDPEYTFAIFTAPVAIDVPTSPELFKWLAVNSGNYLFGHLECLMESENDETCTVIFTHTLLTDYLDAEELRRAVGVVVFTADELDDEFVAKFGGKRFTDS